ncbi:MAG: hypothetical protein Crog4KO_28390 [Crocinitomicaceae bacterium]
MNNLLLLAFLTLTVGGFAQTDKEIELIADETCSCLQSKSKELRNATPEDVQMQLGLCMISSANKVGVEFNMGDPSSLEKLGERVGFQMAFTCPDFLEMVGQMIEDEPEIMNDIMDDDDDYSFLRSSSNGMVLEVSSGDFVTLKISTDTGRKETYYWMEHFDGAHLLEQNGAAIKNKKVIVTYEEIECYSPKLDDYINIRVLRSLAIAE